MGALEINRLRREVISNCIEPFVSIHNCLDPFSFRRTILVLVSQGSFPFFPLIIHPVCPLVPHFCSPVDLIR